jgi:hypothetical protein
MKKLVPIVLVGMFVLCGLQASANPFAIKNSTQLPWNHLPSISCADRDVLDQSQPTMNFFGPIGSGPLWGFLNYMLAQTFIPTKPVLTRVELMIGKNSTTTYDYTVVIRDSVNGPNLAQVSIPAGQITTENFSWIEFDFPDIAVAPGNTYYLISYTENVIDNWYAWGLNMSDVYPNGIIYFTTDDGTTWTEEPSGDMTFNTYGRDNVPPNEPLIQGETNGKVGTEYPYTFSTDDLDGDNVYYFIDWGDGTPVVEWIGPYGSGEVVTVKHSYAAKSTYTISAKAKDTIGAESSWGYLEVTMPKSSVYTFNLFFQQLLERFPHAFPVLRYILILGY